mmetsp:Transcript_11227/g.15568  ORF Transcript_11227/g.15568 Transcript_11227/m.15568 type:complete len:81 (+) Transcript_11227:351-593(+)
MLKNNVQTCQGKQASVPMSPKVIECPVMHGKHAIRPQNTAVDEIVSTLNSTDTSIDASNDANDDEDGSSIVDLAEDAMIW